MMLKIDAGFFFILAFLWIFIAVIHVFKGEVESSRMIASICLAIFCYAVHAILLAISDFNDASEKRNIDLKHWLIKYRD